MPMDAIKFKELDYIRGDYIPSHEHEEGQVLFARSGTMEVTADSHFVCVPASRIVWVPPKVDHSIRFRTDTKMRTAFIKPDLLDNTYKHICVHQATGLFREILLRLVENNLHDQDYKDLLELSLIKEMCSLKDEPFSIKFPQDIRAKRVADALLVDPSNTAKINEWAELAACSSKTLSRLFIKETELTFQLWRRHLRLLLIHDLLDMGSSVTEAAHAVGFATSSALTEAHKKTFGYPPTRLFDRVDK
ncbi:MAG: hypothetical protein COA74_01530 [Gammaproteobacteria bacterium]|nr:MAG: hypothetical protein COA74_01530 [Gammaproteobacteria bacterium]